MRGKSEMMSSPKYVGSYTSDGLLNIVYQVHEIAGDVYVLEAISYFDLITLIASDSEPSDEPVIEQICLPVQKGDEGYLQLLHRKRDSG